VHIKKLKYSFVQRRELNCGIPQEKYRFIAFIDERRVYGEDWKNI
jgi:hypothetical protein